MPDSHQTDKPSNRQTGERIDLHTHSSFSDGAFRPREMVKMARDLGLAGLAICDHDTLDGLEEALAASAEFGVQVITGVELSVDHEDGSLHLLGYNFDHNNSELRDAIETLRRSREERNVKMVSLLNELGYPIRLEDVLGQTREGTYGRAHIAMALVALGYFADVQTAFESLLGNGRPGYLERRRLPMAEAVDLIHGAGGVAVWAHPGLDVKNLEKLLKRLKNWADNGLDGIESDYHDHDIALRDRLRELAAKHDLIYTGGSDFHGGIKPNNKLGEGAGGEPVSVEVLEAVVERSEKVRK